MGITGLLSFLDKASRPVCVSEFSGCTVAVDSYCWLHKGAFSCAEKLARGEKTDQYVNYCMKFVNMLLSYNIKPILVFDGRHLPAKADTEKKRRELREANRKKAAELLRLERETEARSLIQRCVDVTHEMALNLIKQCRSQGVDCIVAPYEADAQLAYLNLNGLAHIVITEDSDLMLFGCKLVLFKMDVFGNGVLVEQSKIALCMKVHPSQFSLDKFRYMCILSGCDYLKSLPGIGLAKACKFIKKTQDNNISRALTRLGAYLNMPNLEVTQDYREKFLEADAMFKYQPVFDPLNRKVVPLNPLPPGVSNPLINLLDDEVCFQMALGNLNPFTLDRVDSWDPDQPQSVKTSSWRSNAHKHKSIWARDYKFPPPLPPKKDPREVEHKSTKGKVASQPVSQLTEKIVSLPPKPNIDEELAKLREAYSVKPPPSKRHCIEEIENEESEIESGDSGIIADIGEKPTAAKNENDTLEDIIQSPQKRGDEEPPGFTIDDIFSELSSPSHSGNHIKNPFSKVSRSTQEKPVRKSLGGALDLFSKLKKTQVEAACVVQSRYFATDSPVEPVASSSKKDVDNKPKGGEDLNDTFLEIIHATPSPKRRKSLPPRICSSLSAKKNIFKVTEIEEAEKEEERKTASPKNSLNTTPRKNCFSVLSAQGSPIKSPTLQPSPKRQSFLQILNEVSKEMNIEENEESSKPETPVRKLGTPSFKWTQPLLDCPKKPGKEQSLLGLYKPTSKHKVSPVPSKSPKISSSLKKNSSPKGRPGSLPEKLTFKRQNTESNSGQKSLLNMFAFQPKPKLTTQ